MTLVDSCTCAPAACETLHGSCACTPELDVRITLRMPDDLAKLVQEAADADRRSKSDWIVLQLEAIFASACSARRASERRAEPSWIDPTRSASSPASLI